MRHAHLPRASRRRTKALAAAAALIPLFALQACADDADTSDAGPDDATAQADPWPTRQIDYVIPYDPGGSTDTAGRAYVDRLSEKLGQTVVPVNQSGGSGLVGVTSVLNSEPDGYTIGFGAPGALLIQPLVDDSIASSSPDKYTPIALMGTGPFGLMVRGDSEWDTLEDLEADAKSRPGEIQIATTGGLAINTFVIAAWAEDAEVDVQIVPFDGSTEAQREVLGGHIDAFVGSISTLVGQVEAGELRGLAVSGDEPFAQLPDVPTFESFGYDVPFEGAYVTLAPKDIPDSVKQKLIDVSTEILTSDDWKQWCAENGVTPKEIFGDDLATWITDQQDSLRPLLELVQGS